MTTPDYWREIGVADVVRLLTPPGRNRKVCRKRVQLLMKGGAIESWAREDSRGRQHWFTTEKNVVEYLHRLRNSSLHFSTAKKDDNHRRIFA